MIVSKKTTKLGLSSTVIAAILAIGLVASIGMMQTSNVAAASGNTIFKERLSEKFASASGTNGETTAVASAFKTASGDTQICVSIYTDDFSTDFFGCGPADNVAIDNGLNSATYSGTITGFDYATGEEKTVTVNAELTATGKVQTTTANLNTHTPDYNYVLHANGKFRPASGSLDISGDLSFSTDDASGRIGIVRQGTIDVERV